MASLAHPWGTVGNVDSIADCLARNPLFHDCEITRVELDRAGPILLLSVEVPDRRGLIDLKREIKIRFTGVADLDLQDFNHQNVIAGLHLARDASGERLHFEVESVFGAIMSFSCGSASVV